MFHTTYFAAALFATFGFALLAARGTRALRPIPVRVRSERRRRVR